MLFSCHSIEKTIHRNLQGQKFSDKAAGIFY